MASLFSQRCTRLITAFLLAFFASFAFAVAGQISVNKQFSPNVVNLGQTSTVTITLQNTSTISAATITAFSDDLATMSGIAQFAASPALANTCGGTPSISGTVVSMSNGSIPKAPSSSTPGSCTISFKVVGAVVGNGFNTISAANVSTSLGGPAGDVTQTLNVQSVNISITSGSAVTTQVSQNGTISFKINNPAAGVALTNVAFAVSANSSLPFTINGASISVGCGGSYSAFPATGTSGSVTFSGITVPAGSSCTVTLQTTQTAAGRVNFTLAASAISDSQGVTNSSAGSTQDYFVTGKPTISKSFSPTTLVPGSNTTLTIRVQNPLSTQALTNAAFSDSLPGSPALTVVSSSATAACGSPTISGVGTSTIGFSGGTIAANSTCQITAVVQVPATEGAGSITNTILASSFTSDQVAGAVGNASASLTTTGAGGGMTMIKSFSPTSSAPNTPFKITLTFNSIGTALTGGTFVDNLPQSPVSMVGYTDATHLPTLSAGCGGSGAVTFTSGNTVANGSGLAVPLSGSCVVTFYAEFPTPIETAQTDTNSITSGNVTFTTSPGGVSVSPSGTSASMRELAALTVTNYKASGENLLNQPIAVTGEITDNAGITDTNVTATFKLTTGKVEVASTPNFVFSGAGCPGSLGAGSVTIAGNRESFVVAMPTISGTCDISYDVIDESGAVGTYVPANPTYSSTLTGGVTIAQTGTNNVTWASSNINITKSFTPNQIQAGSISTVDVKLSVAGVSGFPTTQINGVTFTDSLPSGVQFASVPSVAFTPTCQIAGQPAPSYVISGTSITFSNISSLTTGSTPAACDATFDVTSSTIGAPLNVIAAHGVTSTSGITNASKAQASLTVNAGVAVAKTFVNGTMAIGGTDYMRFLITNSASTSSLTGGTLADAMPSSLALASTTLGPIQGGDPPLCGGAIGSGAVGSSSFTLTGLSVPGVLGSTPGQCVVYVLATTTATAAAPATVTNSIAIGGLVFGIYSNQTATSGGENLTPPPNPTIAKAFLPTSIAINGTSVLTITIANAAAGAAALSGMALTDTLPSGVVLAATPAASTTCGAGTLTAVAGSGSVALAAGSVGAGASCTITVSVTSAATATYTNTIPASALTTTQGATNTNPASANLIVGIPPVTIAKVFSPSTILPGGTSQLTVTLTNAGVGAIALTGVALTDTLPVGITVAATPGAATTCGLGTVTAAAGATSVALSGAAMTAGGSCTITVNVTGTTPNTYNNVIPIGALTSTQGATNTSAAAASLIIAPPPVTITKTFTAASIAPGGTSVLTIGIANAASGAIALTGVGLTDALPAGVSVASTPGIVNACGGSVVAAAGATSIVLSGGAIAAGASCSVAVNVTGTTPSAYTNTIPASALSSTQGVTNTSPASAVLTIAAPPVTLAKSFAPGTIVPGGSSLLTITVANTGVGAIALSGVGLTDALPSGLSVASVPAASTTCAGGSVAALAGALNVVLSGASLAASTTCTILVHVTGSLANTYTNTIPASAVTSTQGITNTSPASAPLTIAIAGTVTVSKAFLPTSIGIGGTSTLTISINNSAVGAIALSSVQLADALPANVTVAAIPAASTTCVSGSVTALAGASSVSLAGASIAAGTNCTIALSVTSSTPGNYTNTIPASALGTAQGATNATPATAVLAVAAPPVTLSKAFSPTSISSGGTSTLTIAIANTAAGAVALTGVALTDTLPSGITIAATPAASTTCAGGSVTALAAGGSVTLSGGSIAAGATCTVTVSVTGTAPNSYTNTIPASALTSTQGSTNTTPTSAVLTVTAPPVAIAKAFSPSTIASGATSVLTITLANTAAGAIALSGMNLSDTLPSGVTVATTPATGTTCATGSVTAVAGGSSVAIAGASLAAGASCTFHVTVTGTLAGAYLNTIPASALTSTQGATNTAPATATLTIAQPSLSVVKTSNPQSASVSPGQTIAYSITVTNNGAVPETNATITDTLGNATLVTGSVKVNGVAAADAIVTAHAPFGSVAANASATITYQATVNAAAAGAAVTNGVTVGGDQACVGPTCSTTSPPNTIVLPQLAVHKTIDGVTSMVALPGEYVTYAITVSNTGSTLASNVDVTDPVPSGVVPVAGTVTLDGAPAAGATITGQSVYAPIGSMKPGAQHIVAFKARVGVNTQGALTNVVSIGAAGLKSALFSNRAVVTSVASPIIVQKTASATVVTVGDRVNYTIAVSASSAIPYGITTVTDTLPAYEVYAPGTSRANGKALEPTVRGQVLTWTFASLATPITITYAVAVASGVPSNTALTNIVDVSAQGPIGTTPSTGSAQATVQVVASTFGSCYPITGRVYYDTHDSGRFDDGDTGIAGVTIFLDDGESVVTDVHGRYNFPCVRPGMHALRLDERTLPPGAEPFDDRNIDSEQSTRRLVHHIFDTTIIEDINFAIRPKPRSP